MSTARDQLYHDLFTTAIEGGIGYWSECRRYKHWLPDGLAETPKRYVDDLNGFYADIIDVETDGKAYRIDRACIVRGYNLAQNEWRTKIRWSSGEPPARFIDDDFDWDYDAGDALAFIVAHAEGDDEGDDHFHLREEQ